MYKNVHSSIVCNSEKLETPQCPLIGEWINNLWITHLMKYHTDENERIIATYNNVDEPQK